MIHYDSVVNIEKEDESAHIKHTQNKKEDEKQPNTHTINKTPRPFNIYQIPPKNFFSLLDSIIMGQTSSSPSHEKKDSQNVPKKTRDISECPMHQKKNDSVTSGEEKKSSHSKMYNVYGQVIDPSNNMPANPNNQQIYADQDVPLSTERVPSTIPKGTINPPNSCPVAAGKSNNTAKSSDSNHEKKETAVTWTYPSPQMMYNAMRRKGKLEESPTTGSVVGEDRDLEEEAHSIISVHNNMNERTWKEILVWEARYCPTDCPQGPRLLRFEGNSEKISPKAYLKQILGFNGNRTSLFDRHDWIIDRCGKEVRYIIDYYYDENKADNDELPTLHDMNSVASITMDIRPALDSPGALFDRLRSFGQDMTPERNQNKVRQVMRTYMKDLPSVTVNSSAKLHSDDVSNEIAHVTETENSRIDTDHIKGESVGLSSRDPRSRQKIDNMLAGKEEVDIGFVQKLLFQRCGQYRKRSLDALESGDEEKAAMFDLQLSVCSAELLGCDSAVQSFVDDPNDEKRVIMESCFREKIANLQKRM